jgi:hypothetical protein
MNSEVLTMKIIFEYCKIIHAKSFLKDVNYFSTTERSQIQLYHFDFCELGESVYDNIAYIIYTSREQGIDEGLIVFSEESTAKLVSDKFYCISSLPEVIATRKISDDVFGVKFSFYSNKLPLIESQVINMDMKDISVMIDDIAEGISIDIKLPLCVENQFKKKLSAEEEKAFQESIKSDVARIKEIFQTE